MVAFSPPLHLTIAFAALSLAVALADVLFVRQAAAAEARQRWTILAALAAVIWLAVHAGIATSGVLASGFPLPLMPYLAVTVLAGVAVVFSPVGRRLADLPLVALVALQAFRLPLEVLLHLLYEADVLPVQMTWSGYNFDVVTAITAIGLAAALASKHKVPDGLVWAWNIMGSALLLTVVTIAVLSAPLPIRQFHNDPPVLFPFHAPYNWIINVHVWTALVGHMVIFRALWSGRGRA